MKNLLVLILLVLYSLTLRGQNVYLENGKFKLNAQNYYPTVVNYGVQLRKNNQNEYWATPHHSYGNTNDYECTNRIDCINEMRAQFQMIKDMGFNAIRLFGIAPSDGPDTNNIGILYHNITLLDPANPQSSGQNVLEELTPTLRTNVFSCLTDVLYAANERGLKVILLCGGPDGSSAYRNNYQSYLISLATNFKNNTAILAYDLFNEPSLFSKMSHDHLSKAQICQTVSGWISTMKFEDPNHLITIGFTDAGTVDSWDPELIRVDFASFHPYGTTDKVGNEIYWYATNMTKPWIIGETGLPADVPLYEQQRQFANIVSRRCIDCGGKGISWWQYQDVWWGSYDDYFGLVSHDGITATTVSGMSIQGTPKPAASEFQNFSSYIPTNNCPMFASYYNPSSSYKQKVSGKIISQSNIGLAGAVIYGRDTAWHIIATTFSKADGSFELYSNSNSNEPIYMINYNYLKMANGTKYLDSLNLNNITVDIGNIITYNSDNKIHVTNMNVKGNGTTGGNVTINSAASIIFHPETKIAAGSTLYASITPTINAGTLLLLPLTSYGYTFKETENNTDLSTLENEITITDDIAIYPNPTNNTFTLALAFTDESPTTFKIYNTLGKETYSNYLGEIKSFEKLIDLNISDGVYLIKITHGNKQYQKKLVISK